MQVYILPSAKFGRAIDWNQNCYISFSGHYVPQLSQIVYQRNKGIQNPVINFKGFLVRFMKVFNDISRCRCSITLLKPFLSF